MGFGNLWSCSTGMCWGAGNGCPEKYPSQNWEWVRGCSSAKSSGTRQLGSYKRNYPMEYDHRFQQAKGLKGRK